MRNTLSSISFALVLAGVSPAQVNDECATAIPLGATVSATTVGFTASSDPWGPWSAGADIWFTWTPSSAGSFRISACNMVSAVDTVVAIYSGSCGQLTWVAGDDDSCGHLGVGAVAEAVLNAGVTYYVRIGTLGPPGDFTITRGPGSGILWPVASGGCSNVDLQFSGGLSLGDALTITTVNATGVPLVGAGLTTLGQSFCGCMVGHDWTVLGNNGSLVVWIPWNPALVGFSFFVQGADVVSFGTCPASGLSLSSTYRATVGF